MQRTLRIGIVGTGPSGFYSGKYLLSKLQNARVDFIDQSPTPYGLVRFGVAPDHQEVKKVQHEFDTLMDDDRCRFLGNVTVGRDVSIDSLHRHYDAVVLACGASGERLLGIPGEQLRGVYSARSFVNWYNGDPAYNDFDYQLENAKESAVIFGQGNVAVDVARMLVGPIDDLTPEVMRDAKALSKTDMAAHAVAALRRSTVRRVYLVGRRGPVQIAATIAELRELSRLPNVSLRVSVNDLNGLGEACHKELAESRALKRKFEFLQSVATSEPLGAEPAAGKEIVLVFNQQPLRILEDSARPSCAGSVELHRTFLSGLPSRQSASLCPLSAPEDSQAAAATSGSDCDKNRSGGNVPCWATSAANPLSSIRARLFLTSIGYMSRPLPGVPFDPAAAVVPSRGGRVLRFDSQTRTTGEAIKGLYVVGWLKRGATGIIGTNISDAKETVASILSDVDSGLLGTDAAARDGAVTDDLDRSVQVVTREGWRRIDEAEQAAGHAAGKPREKLVSLPALLRTARGGG